MAINKVVYGNDTLMDITDTTATANDVANGQVFYTANGVRTLGTSSGGSTTWGNITGTLSDQTDLSNALFDKVDKSVDYGNDVFGNFINDSISGIKLFVNNVYEEIEYGNIQITESGVEINNLITPVNNKDAATKEYVDTRVERTKTINNITSAILNNGGNLMLASINNSTGESIGVQMTPTSIRGIPTPTSDTEPVNKKYVDDIVGDIESLLGGI